MTQTRRSSARSLMAAFLATLLVLTSSLATVAQSPAPAADPSAGSAPSTLGNATVGGVLAVEEGRDTSAPPALLLGTALDGLDIKGVRGAFMPGETFAFRLALPGPVEQIRLAIDLAGSVEGVDALWSYPDLPVDPSWDTVAGTLTAPPVGDYTLRIFKGQDQLAQTPLAVRDVPRLTSLLTDPLGLVSADAERVAAAGQRYEDATSGGWLWNVLIDTTGGIPVSEWAADLWAVNADQIDPRDALFMAAAGDIDVAIVVGSEAARTILPDELSDIEDEAVFALGDGRFADMIDGVANGLVTAHSEGPEVSPSPTPTPEPTPSPTPSTVRVPNFTGLSRDEAELLAARRGLETRITFRRTNEVDRGIVVSQDPPAGKTIELGDTVTLVVATAPQTVDVPNVAGMSVADAVGVLLDAGLEGGDRTLRYSDSVDNGMVIRTDPRAGTAVQPGSVVDFVVSRGPEPVASPTPKPTPAPVEVPNLRGETEEVAIALLLDAKLDIGDRFEQPNNKVAAGKVTKTNPAAGTLVARGTKVDYYISTGPAALSTPTPKPTATPLPARTPRPTAEPTTPAGEDRLARIEAAGVIRVNIAEDDGPWSTVGPGGGRAGFDAAVARAIAKHLGVKVEFTTVPIDEVRAGLWEDRFDIAISRLAITDAAPALLAFSVPYAYDPQQLAVTVESGLTGIDELADRSICVDPGDTGAAWLEGTLALVGSPLEPATPPSGATAYPGPTNADCVALIAATGAPFDAWLASLPSIVAQVAGGLPASTVGDPVLWAPVAVAYDAKAGDNDTLITAIDEALAQLDDDGSLVKASIRALGYDLTAVPEDGVPVAIVPTPPEGPAP